MEERQGVLYARYFGGFSLRWNSAELVGDAGRGDTQFLQLLQLLLHHRETGVERTALIEELFRDREVKDVAHSVNVLLYNARKKLCSLGLPDGKYFEKRAGRICWSGEIPVEEDAAAFEALCRAAQREAGPEALERCLAACGGYGGDFLPMQTGSIWVAHEAQRYREMFADCANRAAALLRQGGQYLRLEELGRYASRVQPLSDWETLTLEALIALGRFGEAGRLYQETEQRYLRELGVRPDRRMAALWGQIQTGGSKGPRMLDAIQAQLSERHVPDAGAYRCGYAAFEQVYRVMERFMQRSGQPVYLMVCTLPEEGEDGAREEHSAHLEQAICAALRKTDVVCRYGKSQYLVLLVNTTREGCAVVRARIDAQFHARRGRPEISYSVRALSGAGVSPRRPAG
ncbi:MAG: hypothetical protein IJ751_09850 [Oscillospiraceae bacterium]|nr:hypothetical protein [Oscillospiraceae bacterium]